MGSWTLRLAFKQHEKWQAQDENTWGATQKTLQGSDPTQSVELRDRGACAEKLLQDRQQLLPSGRKRNSKHLFQNFLFFMSLV